jgi:hypothetical protein
MRARPVLIWSVALVTLGSGMLNLYSVMGRPLPHRRVLLREVFPLEKSGIQTIEYGPPLPEEALLQVKEVSEEWLEIPGRSERGLTLGRFEPNYVRSTLCLRPSTQTKGFLRP